MIGLIVRVLLLVAVVFGVAYGITRALRQNAHSKEAKRIHDEVCALRDRIEWGQISAGEYERMANKIKAACERQGIEVPELPASLHQSQRRGGPDKDESEG